MHVLLDPPAPSRAEALAAVRRWLSGRVRGWGLVRRTLPSDLADGLAVAYAWHRVTDTLLAPGTDEPVLERARDELLATLRDAEAGSARSPLGVALAWWLPRFEHSPLALRARVEALERDARVSAHASRSELRALRVRTVHPEAHALLAVLRPAGVPAPAWWRRPVRWTPAELERANERHTLLAQALAEGIERALALPRARETLAAHGRLALSAEELREADLSPADLLAEDPAATGTAARLARLYGRASDEARTLLRKGWPLCRDLGPWRGRLLALVLRWHAAELAALDHATRRGRPPRPRGGTLRLLACLTTALVTPATPPR